MTFMLLKPILAFKEGYLITVNEQGFGSLGQLPWGWEIPYFIMNNNPEWFKLIPDAGILRGGEINGK